MIGNGARLSIITPAYNEAENLQTLYDRLAATMGRLAMDWEWIVIDDHSSDGTFQTILRLAAGDSRVKGLRFSRNFGSHTAITCGLNQAQGDCAVVMAADLQDPPEVIPDLLAPWSGGAQVVWAVRRSRPGEKASTKGFSRLYYFIMRNISGLRQMPESGADFFLIDARVLQALCRFNESNISLFALITWMGFRQATLHYEKQPRLRGRSGWSMDKKWKLLLDSITSFTYLPIRLMSYAGFLTALAGFVFAGTVVWNFFSGKPPEGYSSLIVVILVLGGMQMMMMGVLGEYVWRALDESRRRPRYLIEAVTQTENLAHGELSRHV